MGAACTGPKSTQVIDSSVIRVSKNGQQHLKNLKLDTNYRNEDLYDKDNNQLGHQHQERMHEALWNAVESNNTAVAEKFLSLNEISEANLYDMYGQSMIHKAASLGLVEMLMLLLERTGATPDLVNAQLATPLHIACKSNRLSISKFLIGCGVDVNQQDEHGQTPLLLCCIHANTELASMLIEASISGHLPEPIEVDLADSRGLTPLNCSAIKGDLEMVKILVSRGNSNTNQSSPKGCTPLMYAGRGGYSECVRFLLEKKASALKQDNAGGTVLHHAIEKGHINVLETLLEHGIDVYSVIEVADNAGRTPIFEAVENMLEDFDNTSSVEILKILTKKKSLNGFGAKVNILNFQGQTPLFSAAREGNLEAVQALLEANAKVDLNNGELMKPEEDLQLEIDEEESLQEKYFMEAFKNCMTPLHVSCCLGYDSIALYLIEHDANPNLRTLIKGYTSMHLAVLSNKPEILIELLTKTNADPLIEDEQGRTLLDMVYLYIPSYVQTFQSLLENLQMRRLQNNQLSDAAQAVNVLYVNQDDERKIQGIKDQLEAQEMYQKEVVLKEQDNQTNQINLNEIDEHDIQIEGNIDERIENIFGRKVAMCLIATNWQYKEYAMKFVYRTIDKYLTKVEISQTNFSFTITEMVDAALAAVTATCKEKVIKVFNLSLQLFNMVIQSSRVEKDFTAMAKVTRCLKNEKLISKFLAKSEETNTRVTNKIHEALLDLSYHAGIGEGPVISEVYDMLKIHNKAQHSNSKGMLAQLALLYKLINSFQITLASTLQLDDILVLVLPSLTHTKEDVKNAAIKILVDAQKQTGQITEDNLIELPEKIRITTWEKLQNVLQEREEGNEVLQENQPEKGVLQQRVNVVNLSDNFKNEKNEGKMSTESFEKFKAIINEKGQHKDWTQREIALNTVQECFQQVSKKILETEEKFLSQCLLLLTQSLEENNIQIYLIAMESTSVFLKKAIASEIVLDFIPGLIKSIVLKTTDTNTRVRKRSVELINQIWEEQIHKKSEHTISQIIASVICDSNLGEKAIIGRLGLFIKKAMLIETADDLNKKPLNFIIGKDYEQLTEFTCIWSLHKNTKVRQCALKLITEICRLNHIDPRGAPFKQRIVNFILGLKISLRDPLLKKINEICMQAGDKSEAFINEGELELNFVTKHRAQSLNLRKDGSKQPSQVGKDGEILPQISGIPEISHSGSRPTIVLPHSEPLTDEQKKNMVQLIDLFGLDLITCFQSQTWSTRQVAIQKLEEQILNLDPNQRDAMYGEINRNNIQPEISYKIFLKFADEGLKDPVLKNFISVLELIQKGLPVFFRYLKPEQIKRELIPLVTNVVQKTSDLKQKVREASINFCLYLSHQSPIGSDAMIQQILNELENCKWDKQVTEKDVQNSYGNSHMIASCLKLLQEYQSQTRLVTLTSSLYALYALNINRALKHQNPQVRKEGESLFKQMYIDFGESYGKELKDQKPQIVTKLLAEAKQDSQGQDNQIVGEKTSILARQPTIKEQEASDLQRTQIQIRDDYLSEPSIQLLLKGNEDKIQQLKMPNPKKRLQAIIDIKKIVLQKLNQVNQKNSNQLVEPFSLLMRHLLRDESTEVYLESLNLLKFIVGSLAPHLSALDLHLMMGSLIGLIVSTNATQMRIRVASDKVVVFFAKHSNIGSVIVAKEILKNIEKLNKTAFIPSNSTIDSEQERKSLLARFYSILQMLIQQFSIVLCYQPDFYQKCLEHCADTMAKCGDEPLLKTTCNQMIVSLYQIDAKMLEERVQALDFTKKANIKKVMIELQNSVQRGQHLITQPVNLIGGERQNSPDQSFRDTQQSFTSQNTRGNIMSPTMNNRRQLTTFQNLQGTTSESWNQMGPQRAASLRSSRPNASQQGAGNQILDSAARRRDFNQENLTGTSWMDRTNKENDSIVLPDINNTESRRKPGVGFVGGGVGNKAAGFKSDFNSTGTYGTKGILDKTDFSISTANGLGSGLFTAKKLGEDAQIGSGISPIITGAPTQSNRQRFTIENNLNDSNSKIEKPPLYIPTQRTNVRKDTLANETLPNCTIISKHSQQLAQLSEESNTQHLFGGRKTDLRGDQQSKRYLPQQQSPDFGQQIVTPTLMKMKPKAEAPPVATFQVNTVQEQSRKQPKQYKPDILL